MCCLRKHASFGMPKVCWRQDRRMLSSAIPKAWLTALCAALQLLTIFEGITASLGARSEPLWVRTPSARHRCQAACFAVTASHLPPQWDGASQQHAGPTVLIVDAGFIQQNSELGLPLQLSQYEAALASEQGACMYLRCCTDLPCAAAGNDCAQVRLLCRASRTSKCRSGAHPSVWQSRSIWCRVAQGGWMCEGMLRGQRQSQTMPGLL